jgi:hypothetical protein
MAPYVTTDLRRLVSQVHRLHDSTELHDFVELFGVGECFVHALAARFKERLLVDGFRSVRNPLVGFRASLTVAKGQPAECHGNSDDRIAPRGPMGHCQIRSLAHHRPPDFVSHQGIRASS